jgi:hypothetical protein
MENKLGFCWFGEGSVLGFHEQKKYIHSSPSILDAYSIHKFVYTCDEFHHSMNFPPKECSPSLLL